MRSAARTLTTLARYGAFVVPVARSEIHRWADAAAGIPDLTLRSHATNAIVADAGNAEAAAAFAAFSPPRHRRAAIELLVGYQILVDHVDMLGEHVYADRLACGLAIGLALAAAVAPPGAPLRLGSLGDDGGYLAALIAVCRDRLWRFPSAAAVESAAATAALRCGQGLAYTHTAARHGTTAELRRWATAQDGAAGYAWWEIAAGSNSNLAIHALLAAAVDPLTTRRDAAAIAGAYWPHVCVMSTLFDSLVDYERDATGENFSFVSHYPDSAAVQAGVLAATRRSLEAVKRLRHSHTHTMIVCGVAGYYAAAATPGSLAAKLAPGLTAALGRTAAPIVLGLRAQRWLGTLRERQERGSSAPTSAIGARHR